MVVWPRSGSESLELPLSARQIPSMPTRREKKNLLDDFDIALHRHIAHRLRGDEDELLADGSSGGDDLY